MPYAFFDAKLPYTRLFLSAVSQKHAMHGAALGTDSGENREAAECCKKRTPG